MEVSSAQKLITLLLCDLLRDKSDRELDPDFIAAALTTGQTWAIPAQYPAVDIREDVSSDVVKDVQNILTMWNMLKFWCDELEAPEKAEVESLARGYRIPIEFPGFDGNLETDHYSTAKFIRDQMSGYGFLTGKSLNSHAPMLTKYHRMLLIYNKVLEDIMVTDMPTPVQIASVLNA